MSTAASLEEALALALKLAPKERLQLIEQVASSIEREIAVVPSDENQPEEHWGRNLLRLLDELGPIEMKYPEIEDPVEWVRQIRRDERKQRLGDLDEEE
ncbi:MAG: hypothetical protein IT320_05875 [Anaerolineae bacterium]|nr:hypothetical protein [Anaerolineae bacterium]